MLSSQLRTITAAAVVLLLFVSPGIPHEYISSCLIRTGLLDQTFVPPSICILMPGPPFSIVIKPLPSLFLPYILPQNQENLSKPPFSKSLFPTSTSLSFLHSRPLFPPSPVFLYQEGTMPYLCSAKSLAHIWHCTNVKQQQEQ